MDQPSGPSSQRFTSSGLVKASNTILRGALRTRIITISRSPVAATFSPPWDSIWVLLLFFAVIWAFGNLSVSYLRPKESGPCMYVLRSTAWARFFLGWISFRRGVHRGAGICLPRIGGSFPAIGWLRPAVGLPVCGGGAGHRVRARPARRAP